jgi:hypothetical protein
MSIITRTHLEELGTATGGPRVSIYQPTHRAGREAEQDPIRFRNLLMEAEARLGAGGAGPAVIARTLAPARALLEDPEFWARQQAGLAVFLVDGSMEVLRLPVAAAELVVSGDRFHVKPLIPLLDRNGPFHLLAISQRGVRLYECDRDSIRQLELQGVPGDLHDAVGWDWKPRSLQSHSSSGSRGVSAPTAVFHGDGSPADDRKTEIASFLRQVDDGVTASLGDSTIPLLLVGVRYVTAIYRGVTRHANVLAETLEGNPDELTAVELHRRAGAIVTRHQDARAHAAVRRYGESLGGRRASSDLEVILPAAFDGRIDTLLVGLEVERWGAWDGRARQAELHAERRNGDVDLVDVAAVQALRTGAEVHAVPAGQLPGNGEGIAAVFRY